MKHLTESYGHHPAVEMHEHFKHVPEFAAYYEHKATRLPVSSTFTTDFNEQSFHRSGARLVDESVYEDYSIERNIFEKTVDEISKIEGTLSKDRDDITDLLMDRFSTVIDRDQSALREIPSDYFIY